MAHKIDQPHDRVLSVQGTEWHGLAEQVEVIDDQTVEPLLFDIKESPCFVKIDGRDIMLDQYKTLVADHRACRDDLKPEDQIVPLHIPKAGYQTIPNRAVWETMQKALKDLGAIVSSVCTLERGKKFAISCQIKGEEGMVVKGDKFRNFVNFLTSHDGTMAFEAFDTNIRVVCMNTFQWSRGATGEAKFKVYHTKNATMALDGLADLLQVILKGRAEVKEILTYLAGHKCDANDALAMAAGYFAITTDSQKLSTRSWNASTEIQTLFARGIGNKGETLYDLLNGATEYWTIGAGTGADGATIAQRTYRAAMGSGAEHKVRFLTMLGNEDERKEMLTRGKDAVTLALASN
jgi:hypothetical protein